MVSRSSGRLFGALSGRFTRGTGRRKNQALSDDGVDETATAGDRTGRARGARRIRKRRPEFKNEGLWEIGRDRTRVCAHVL